MCVYHLCAMSWGDGWEVKSIYCSCRGLGFSSQYFHENLQPTTLVISDILFCLPEAPQSHMHTLDVGGHTLKCLFKKDQRKAEERRRKKWKDGEEGAVREEWLPRTAQLSAEDLSFTQKQSWLLLFYFYFIQAWIVCVCLTEYSFHIPSS